MTVGPTIGEGCWPTPLQQLLLGACFLPKARADEEFETWSRQVDLSRLDETSLRFLPLLYRRWGDDPLDLETAEYGRRVYLALRAQNRQRLSLAADLLETLEEAGVNCLLLKGIALIARHYRDSGLRAMADVDVLIHPHDVRLAVSALEQSRWIAEQGFSIEQILGQRRVGHAWQFSRGDEESCDLHWRPVTRCYSPAVAELFWRDAEVADICGHPAKVPCPTDQFFHVCIHGLQWSWTPQIRWIADALTILRSSEALDWDRLLRLAKDADMTVRLQHALGYLKTRLAANIPDEVVDAAGAAAVGKWERREYVLLQKPCPLGPLDSASWHAAHFRRIRRFDREWASKNYAAGFLEYLALFLNVRGSRELFAALWGQLRGRFRK